MTGASLRQETARKPCLAFISQGLSCRWYIKDQYLDIVILDLSMKVGACLVLDHAYSTGMPPEFTRHALTFSR